MVDKLPPPPPHSAEPSPDSGDGLESPFRRVLLQGFAKVLGLGGVAALADQIGGGFLSRPLMDAFADPEEKLALHRAAEDMAHEMESNLDSLKVQMDREHPDLGEREKALKIIDYLGAGVFAWGIGALLSGSHIKAIHYAALGALSAAKYSLSNEQERHHLIEETKSNAKAFGIIAGTIVVAEGTTMDLEAAYEALERSQPLEQKDRVALMTMFASCLSPAATTVGSASIVKKMSNALAAGDEDIMAICVSHVSNLSGFLGIGDPPFIAINEKFGQSEGFLWQFRTMLPMALYSLVSATYKINLALANKCKDLPTSESPAARAFKDTRDGLLRNVPVLATLFAHSFKNLGKFFGPDLHPAFGQDVRGLQFHIGEVLQKVLSNVAKLPFSSEFDRSHHHEDVEGMTQSVDPGEQARGDYLKGVLEALLKARGGYDDQASEVREFNCAVDDRDFEQMEAIGKALGFEHGDLFIRLMREQDENAHAPRDAESADHPSQGRHFSSVINDAINPFRLYDRATDLNRVKGAIGHNLGDVVDVFPFQAGCVPFLTTVFKDIAHQLQSIGLNETQQEVAMFLLIMFFSSLADNYVACKIGLELFPNKPEIPLISSIIGGSLSAVGNMANVAQFTLDDFPLGVSFAKFRWHLDTVGVGLVWSQVLPLLQKSPLGALVLGQAPKLI